MDRETLGSYAERFCRRREVERARPATVKKYRRHIRLVLEAGALAELEVARLTTRHLVELRARLLERMTPASARSILGSSFRAMIREAVTVDELLAVDPFDRLPKWPRQEKRAPDPFEPWERDRIIAHFAAGHYAAFVVTAFWTGARPSELVALRRRDVILSDGSPVLQIERSRVGRCDWTTKTAGSRRVVPLLPRVCEVLRPMLPAAGDAFVFTDRNGSDVCQQSFNQHVFQPALRHLGIRRRPFYATRATFISECLTRGMALQLLAQITGNSPVEIQRSYARFFAGAVARELLLVDRAAVEESVCDGRLELVASSSSSSRESGLD